MARPGFTNHPKFRRLSHILGIPAAHALGLCEFLWQSAYESGDAVIGDAVDIELASQWTGERGALTRALLDCGGGNRAGLIEPVEGSPERYQIHDLLDHAPAYVAARRSRETERQKPRHCAWCETEFRSTESHARFCCDACRKASNRASKPTGTDEHVTDGHDGVRDMSRTVTGCHASPAPAPAPAPIDNTNTESAPAARAATGKPSPVFVRAKVIVPERKDVTLAVNVESPSEYRLGPAVCPPPPRNAEEAPDLPTFSAIPPVLIPPPTERDSNPKRIRTVKPARVVPGSPHKRLIEIYCDHWTDRYGGPSKNKYPFVKGKDGALFKLILENVNHDLEHASQVIIRYFDNRDEFYVKDRHGPGTLVAHLRRFLVDAPSPSNNQFDKAKMKEHLKRMGVTEFE